MAVFGKLIGVALASFGALAPAAKAQTHDDIAMTIENGVPIISAAVAGMKGGSSLMLMVTTAATTQSVPQSDSAEIKSIMTSFDEAIAAKDLPKLTALFYEDKINWLATGHPESRAFAAKLTGMPVAVLEAQGANQMLDNPQVKQLALREHFGQPTIISDGQLASVTFKYDFRVNNAVQNWGLETWQMVKTEGGWKVVNLIFSYNVQQVAPEPENHLICPDLVDQANC